MTTETGRRTFGPLEPAEPFSDFPSLPRPEYPRPSAARSEWMNLNGEWGFEVDQGDSGIERGLRERALAETIVVPFAPESQLSGIENTDFLEAVWYRREVTIPARWSSIDEDVHVLLHFGAVDFETTVWANGIEVARHRGGFTPFTADLHEVARPGTHVTLVVRARDSHHGSQARGKQTRWFANESVFYTRTTGIWQTVWLEPVPALHLGRPHIVPDVAARAFHVRVPLSTNRKGWSIHATLFGSTDTGNHDVLADAEVPVDADLLPALDLTVPADQVRPWGPGEPNLYGISLELRDDAGNPVDEIRTYAGLRSVTIDGQLIRINGTPVFQRLVLDQGYWPESLMTAPDDSALVRDIQLGLNAGFNGARLHQKVFEERYLFHADRLGYLVWAEFPDWGANQSAPKGHNQQPTLSFVTEWLEEIQRDRSHPSIIGWCPLNETYEDRTDRQSVLDDATHGMLLAAKLADGTRPVLDASGYSHRDPRTDVWDAHLYEQNPAKFAQLIRGIDDGQPYTNTGTEASWSVPYRGQPYWISEFGGIWWDPETAESATGSDQRESWGYGPRVHSEDELQERFAALVDVLLNEPHVFGYCYTQLTDVFQEKNGIYNFDRSEKLDVGRIRDAQQKPAAVESLSDQRS